MPLLVIPLILLVILAIIALLPLTLIQRYRVGTSRQLARGWLAVINLVGLSISVVLFVGGAAMTTFWIPYAFTYTLTGLTVGAMLGVIGLALTTWEATSRGLYFTPNRWLVLGLTLVVTARVGYGFWRGYESWRSAVSGESWIVESGAAGALAAGAVVLGYYLIFWIGVRRRFDRHRPR
jgi:hypothetical protein